VFLNGHGAQLLPFDFLNGFPALAIEFDIEIDIHELINPSCYLEMGCYKNP
jgi:hypothetical protein